MALPQLERVFGSIQVGGPDTHVGTISTVTLGGSNESALRVDGTLVVGGAVLSHIGHLDIPYAVRHPAVPLLRTLSRRYSLTEAVQAELPTRRIRVSRVSFPQ